MDQLARIESKIDALLNAGNVTWEEPQPEPPPEMTEAQKDAIANAPVVAVPPPPEQAQTEEAQQQALANAPKVSVPGQPGQPAQEGEIAPSSLRSRGAGSVTVETEQPSGQTDVTTIPPPEGETPPSVPRRR
jgi:hypothetical protein